ncbi:MAG: hypothetical protein FWC70_04225 [Defluviitaleaceae bacterium]|nr:hypothetical protein [Defluviitaleaceae bacterium]
MTKTKTNIKLDKNVKERASRLSEGMVSDRTTDPHGNPLLDLINKKSILNIMLPADENGRAYIDKDLHPELYDWAVNG